ncbi:hypothetical protein AB0O47_40060 [Streptomyces noursei]|uniref:hypothetical protein n=1 Tax=Streptomyces noursei TaxID=1971 RepID=UPI00344E9F9A
MCVSRDNQPTDERPPDPVIPGVDAYLEALATVYLASLRLDQLPPRRPHQTREPAIIEPYLF